MFDPYRASEDQSVRSFVDVDAELDSLDFEDEIALGSDDLNYALGRPCDVDFTDD